MTRGQGIVQGRRGAILDQNFVCCSEERREAGAGRMKRQNHRFIFALWATQQKVMELSALKTLASMDCRFKPHVRGSLRCCE